MDNLLSSAVQHILGKDPEPVGNIIPEIPNHSGQIHLGKPGEAAKRVRERLAELKKQDQAELHAEADALKAEIKAEKQIAADGDFDLKTEIEKGTPREKLAEMRAAADLAHEVIAIREEALDTVNDRLELMTKNWTRIGTQIKTTMENIQSSYMVYLQAYCGGDRTVIKLNPDRPVRAMKALITGEQMLRERLKDDELVDDLMTELTTFDIPSDYPSLLWHFTTARDRKEQFNDTQPTFNHKEQ